MTQRDFERDGQKFWFEAERLIDGRTWRIYRTECAICRKPIRTRGIGSSKMVSRRCSDHGLKGATVGSKAEAAWIELKGWVVAPGSVVDRMRKEGRAPGIARKVKPKPVTQPTPKSRSDPRLAEKAKKEPTPRERKVVTATKRQMAAARAEKVRRRKERFAKKLSGT